MPNAQHNTWHIVTILYLFNNNIIISYFMKIIFTISFNIYNSTLLQHLTLLQPGCISQILVRKTSISIEVISHRELGTEVLDDVRNPENKNYKNSCDSKTAGIKRRNQFISENRVGKRGWQLGIGDV